MKRLVALAPIAALAITLIAGGAVNAQELAHDAAYVALRTEVFGPDLNTQSDFARAYDRVSQAALACAPVDLEEAHQIELQATSLADRANVLAPRLTGVDRTRVLDWSKILRDEAFAMHTLHELGSLC